VENLAAPSKGRLRTLVFFFWWGGGWLRQPRMCAVERHDCAPSPGCSIKNRWHSALKNKPFGQRAIEAARKAQLLPAESAKRKTARGDGAARVLATGSRSQRQRLGRVGSSFKVADGARLKIILAVRRAPACRAPHEAPTFSAQDGR
jgi:hypothetical protein